MEIPIKMPKGCRYMSDCKELQDILPVKGWYILNKTVCGCGGTTTFLESNDDLILISPRTNMLRSKHKQFPGTHLFREKKNDKIEALKESLEEYIQADFSEIFGRSERRPRKILVTIDSFKHVADIIGRDRMKRYTVLETLARSNAKSVCFMSATPIRKNYLEYVDYFKDLPYYKLEWDPDVIDSPTIRNVIMKKDETPRTICREIIEKYKRDGYFARKIVNGEVVYSREICIFINEVKTIVNIIKDNRLKPEEVSILCSDSTSQKNELTRMGFTIGRLITDKKNPRNTTFTFLTKASFEGLDMYSDNSSTIVFVNGHKEWETHDISIDLPQILARQRLESNPFRRDAIVYSKTKEHPKSKDEIGEEIQGLYDYSKAIIDQFQQLPEMMKYEYAQSLRVVREDERYKRHFIDVIDLGRDGFKLEINQLIIMARLNMWEMQNHYYSHPIQLVKGIDSNMKNNYRQKPEELERFERAFYWKKGWQDQLRMYTIFSYEHPEFRNDLRANPYIPLEFHTYFDVIGPERLAELDYRQKLVEAEFEFIRRTPEIIELCIRSFKSGQFYSNEEVKMKLTEIYLMLGMNRTASAIDIGRYLDVDQRKQKNEDGSRTNGFIIC
jgi:hypothetical protein